LSKPDLGDRYEAKFLRITQKLADRYARKVTSQFGRVKDRSESIQGRTSHFNPNDYPSDVQEAT